MNVILGGKSNLLRTSAKKPSVFKKNTIHIFKPPCNFLCIYTDNLTVFTNMHEKAGKYTTLVSDEVSFQVNFRVVYFTVKHSCTIVEST